MVKVHHIYRLNASLKCLLNFCADLEYVLVICWSGTNRLRKISINYGATTDTVEP